MSITAGLKAQKGVAIPGW